MNKPISEMEAARQTFLLSARAIEASFGRFAAWLSAGVGATLSLLVINLDKLSTVVSIPALKWAVALLVVSLVSAVVSKLLAAWVESGLAASENVKELEVRLLVSPSFRLDEYVKETQRGLFFPASLLTRRAQRKVQDGDFAAAARDLVILAQMRMWLLLVEVVLALGAAVVVVSGVGP